MKVRLQQTKWNRDEYQEMRASGHLKTDGVNVQYMPEHGPLSVWCKTQMELAGKRNVVDATGETDVAQKAKGKDFGVRYKANPGSLVKQARGKGGNKQLKGDEMNKGGAIRGDVQASSGSTSCPSGNVSPSIAKYFAFLFTQWSGVRQVGSCHDRRLALSIELKIDISGKSKRLAKRNPGAVVEAMDRDFRRSWIRRSSNRPC